MAAEHSKASVENASPPPLHPFILSTLLPFSSSIVAVSGELPADWPRHLPSPLSKSSEKSVSLVSTDAGWQMLWKAANSRRFGSPRIRVWQRVKKLSHTGRHPVSQWLGTGPEQYSCGHGAAQA